MEQEKIILGIDPGTTLMGYGVITTFGKQSNLKALGTINLTKEKDHYVKIKKIFEFTLELIDKHHPDELAIEAPFFGKNVQSMLKLGRAQGAAISAALYRDIPIFEYAPRKIKQSITGKGAASKEQVAGFLQTMFQLKEIPKNLDATDGLAAAVCHFYQQQSPITAKGYKNWNEYIKKNPDKIN